MKSDEIVRGLRNCKAYKTKSDLQTTMLMTADLIESLQAQLDRKCEHERRAVKCICDVEACLQVLANATEYIKPNTGVWHTTMIALDAIKDWRGPQGAGKGDAE